MNEIYRVEHKESHLGPFQTNDVYTQELARKASQIRYLRAPGDDGLYMVSLPWTYVFGCPSLNALKRWIFLGGTFDTNEEIVRRLHSLGFVLAEYLVDDDSYARGASGLQVAFDADSAREDGLVEYRDLTELLSESPLVFCINDLAI